MSKFCGKCDFADTVEMYVSNDKSYEEFISGADIYIGNNILPLRVNSKKDLVAYYPFLESIMCANKEHRTIILHDKSFIDEEEEDRLNWKLDNCIKTYKKYKRNKKEFVYSEELLKECFYFGIDECEKEILKRVCELGTSATIEGIHTKMHDYYRKEWLDEMVNSGWDYDKAYKWVYGFSRWCEMKRENKDD